MSDDPELIALRAKHDRLRAELLGVEREIAEKTPARPPEPPPLPAASAVPERESIELRFGRVWMVRIGIVLLVTGLVLFGNLAWREFVARAGPAPKLLAIALAGGLLAGAGFVLKRTSAVVGYARVLIAGGLAVLYYCAYAAHFVPTLRVVPSPLAAGLLLLAAAFLVFWVADRERSRGLAGATILLAFYTTAINPVGGFPVVGSLVLAVGAVILLLRRRWSAVPAVGVLACYAAFSYWRVFGSGGMPLWQTIAVCGLYWIVFQTGVVLGRVRGGGGGLPIVAMLNNGGFVAATLPWVSLANSHQTWAFLLGCGGVLLGLALASGRKSAVGATHLAQGLALVSASVVIHFSGSHAAIFFALAAVGALRLGRFAYPRVLQVFSGAAMVLAAGGAVLEIIKTTSGAVPVACFVAAVAAFCAWLFKRQRGEEERFRWRVVAFVAVAAGLLGFVLFRTIDLPVYALCGAGILMALISRPLRLPEFASVFQFFPALAALDWLFGNDRAVLPSAVLALSFLLFSAFARDRVGQQIHSLAAAGVAAIWALSRFDAEPFAAWVLSLLALAFVLGGCLPRLRSFALAGEVLSWLVLLVVTRNVLDGSPWPWSAAALVAAAARLGLPATQNPGYRKVAWVAIGLVAILMLQSCLGPGLRLPVLTAVSVGLLFFWRSGSSSPILLTGVTGLVVGTAGLLVSGQGGGVVPFFSGVLMLAAAVLCEERRNPAAVWVPAFAGTLLVWGTCDYWLARLGVSSTVAAALLGFVLLAAGFALRRRALRLPALWVILVAVVRVFAFDVWLLPVPVRIVSFLVLGGVLVVLGFFYNRYSEKIRRWL